MTDRYILHKMTLPTAGRYASAILTMAVSLRLSPRSRCFIDKSGRIKLVLGMVASFDLSHTALFCCNEIQKTTAITLLSSGTLS